MTDGTAQARRAVQGAQQVVGLSHLAALHRHLEPVEMRRARQHAAERRAAGQPR